MGVREAGCRGVGHSGAGHPSRSLNDNMGMKKHGHPRSKKGGKTGAKQKHSTPAQRRARNRLGAFSRMWSELTEEQRTAWRRRAKEADRLVRQGQYYRLEAQPLFNKLNSVLALCEREPLTDPPPQPKFGPNPVRAFDITGTGDGIALKLSVSGSPAEDIMVFASPPYSAGRSFCADFRFLGLLPTPVEHVSDITRLYIEKYGVPPVNTRVFIRVWQQVDGWECRGQMRIFDALVKSEGGAAGGQTGWPSGWKKGIRTRGVRERYKRVTRAIQETIACATP